MSTYSDLAKPFMTSGNKGIHVKELADLIVSNHPHITETTEKIAKKLSAKFSIASKKKKGSEFLKVGNGKGGYKRGYYKLSKKQSQIDIIKPTLAVGVNTLFTGKGGEHAVLSELLFRGYNASIMTVDDGIDIVASKDNTYSHIQVKSSINDNNSFQFSINKSSYNRHKNQNTYYILVCRRMTSTQTNFQNDMVILPQSHIDFFISRKTVSDKGKSLNFNVSISNKGKNVKFTLNKSGAFPENLNAFINNFDSIK